MTINPPLSGMGILVTRPAHQADGLCHLIEAQGGTAIRFPCLEIVGLGDLQPAQNVIQRFDHFDKAIFTSANAVNYGLPLINAQWPIWPTGLQPMAIGKATAAALKRQGITHCQVSGPPFTSEALLTLAELQVLTGQTIIIFNGAGGRKLLETILISRGAAVTVVPVYQRRPPREGNHCLALLARWQKGEIHAVIATSNESLENLFAMMNDNGQPWLCKTPLVVISARTQQLARKLGFQQSIMIAREASDIAIVEALIAMGQIRSNNYGEQPCRINSKTIQ